jgi:hypothetical protein
MNGKEVKMAVTEEEIVMGIFFLWLCSVGNGLNKHFIAWEQNVYAVVLSAGIRWHFDVSLSLNNINVIILKRRF